MTSGVFALSGGFRFGAAAGNGREWCKGGNLAISRLLCGSPDNDGNVHVCCIGGGWIRGGMCRGRLTRLDELDDIEVIVIPGSISVPMHQGIRALVKQFMGKA